MHKSTKRLNLTRDGGIRPGSEKMRREQIVDGGNSKVIIRAVNAVQRPVCLTFSRSLAFSLTSASTRRPSTRSMSRTNRAGIGARGHVEKSLERHLDDTLHRNQITVYLACYRRQRGERTGCIDQAKAAELNADGSVDRQKRGGELICVRLPDPNLEL